MFNFLKLANNEQAFIAFLFFVQVICLLVILIISFERFYRFRRAKLELKSFLQGIFNVMKNNKTIEAVSICDKFLCPVSEVVRAMILAPKSENATLAKEAAEQVGEVEIGQLELGLRILSALVYIGALLGMIGVLGSLSLSFTGMTANAGRFPFEVLKPHLETACLMATSGMALTLLAYISYHYYLSKLDLIRLDMEKAAIEMSNFLVENNMTKEDVERVS